MIAYGINRSSLAHESNPDLALAPESDAVPELVLAEGSGSELATRSARDGVVSTSGGSDDPPIKK